jgi:hypothetical protein
LNEEINETAVYILLKSDFNRIGEGFWCLMVEVKSWETHVDRWGLVNMCTIGQMGECDA